MAMLGSIPRNRDALPSINHLDLDKANTDAIDRSRLSMMPGLNISTAALASPATYSGPPPPYSHSSSVSSGGLVPTVYTSPSDTARTIVKDDKESRQSLPSISEALGQDKAMAYSTPIMTTQPTALSHQPMPAPSSAVGHSFPEAPVGPSNPFSQPPPITQPLKREHGKIWDDVEPSLSNLTALNTTEPHPQASQAFGNTRSPTFSSRPLNPQGFNIPGSTTNGQGGPVGSPSSFAPYRSPFAFSTQAPTPSVNTYTSALDPYRPPHVVHSDPQKVFAPKMGCGQSYSESVKRHLEVFDTQYALQEIAEASAHNHEFAHKWAVKAQQAPRSSYFPEVLPEFHDVDDALRRSHRMIDNLSRMKDAVIAQQNALAEQRARTAKGNYFEEEFDSLHDDYKGGGYGGSDAKKRRGKAAPPGRCHSCNRAETPEWRRGPDGARTLCNACGLHYAKLTRKMGANKASSIAGSNLRPKNHDGRSPPQ